ncbi:histidine ammonia-lyase [Algoriphagus namhaensis]
MEKHTLPTFNYGEDQLTASLALGIARGEIQGIIPENVERKISASAQAVEHIAASDRIVYGINTGFGPLCTSVISPSQTAKLQENLLKSHAVGVGKPIAKELAKLMMILKVHALAQGFSGIRMETVSRIFWMIEQDIIPVVPRQGSVGASGDLAPLSHLFLPLIGCGEVFYEGKKKPTLEILSQFDLQPLSLGPKEGLALINGTQFMAAHGIWIVEKLHRLLHSATVTSALMLDGLMASAKPFSPELHQLRPHSGAIYVAKGISNLLEGSEILASHADCTRVQDPYSLRCIPQVHGASFNAWLHLKETLEVEINSVTDNPVVFDEHHSISGGHFHGQPIALVFDYACLAAAELGNIADRRIYLSIEGDTPGVPKLLLKETGLNSGLMIPQYTTAALVSENKGLCFPSSADSIPTSLGQEDHVSMGSIGARKALRVIKNVEQIIGIELFYAVQALDFHQPKKSGYLLQRVYESVRQQIPSVTQDREMSGDLAKATEFVCSGKILELAESLFSKPGPFSQF